MKAGRSGAANRDLIHTQDADFTLLCCDVLDGLRSLPDESVHCVVTSPPYWGLRDYGTGEWEGGDPECDHLMPPGGGTQASGLANYPNGLNQDTIDAKVEQRRQQYRELCGKCGARRVDQQLGLESTPDLYVQRIVEVFREVRRVLRADGTCWVNLGDSYAGGEVGRNDAPAKNLLLAETQKPRAARRIQQRSGLKPKDLVGIPWRTVFALQADGWYLRSDIIWSKPNPMPESVTDRPTKAHEYVFLLSKSPRYFFDQEAVREPAEWQRWGAQTTPKHYGTETTAGWIKPKGKQELLGEQQAKMRGGDTKSGFNERWFNGEDKGLGRNVRSVWEIATQPYPEAHFATYPEELVRRCVLAGTSERGCCPVCGKPWEREVEREFVKTRGNAHPNTRVDPTGMDAGSNLTHALGGYGHYDVTTTGWHPGCGCRPSSHPLAEPYQPIPCTVLDPFLGSGTTAHVARKHGRRSIGIELNPAYAELAARRMQQQSLFALEAP